MKLDDKNWIIDDCNRNSWYLFGRVDDRNLLQLIPEAEQLQKWHSICYDCHYEGQFCAFGKILCRRCRNCRTESLEKFKKACKGLNKRKLSEVENVEPNSNDKLVKRTLNLSLADSTGNDENEASSNEDHRPTSINNDTVTEDN